MNAETYPVRTHGPIMSKAATASVVLVDGQSLTRSAVRRALVGAELEVLSEADSARTGAQAVVHVRPDVVLIDIALPGGSAIEAIEHISLLAPASRVLVLTDGVERRALVEAIVAGARGYILKDAGFDAIIAAVRTVAAGECVISPQIAGDLLAHIRERDIRVTAGSESAADAIRATLTKRELDVFGRLASGESNRDIGAALCLSENTIRNHVGSILAKLHLENRIQAAVQAVRTGFSCIAGLPLMQLSFGEADLAVGLMSLCPWS